MLFRSDCWFDGEVKKDIQSETVEDTKGRSHGEEVSLLEGRDHGYFFQYGNLAPSTVCSV